MSLHIIITKKWIKDDFSSLCFFLGKRNFIQNCSALKQSNSVSHPYHPCPGTTKAALHSLRPSPSLKYLDVGPGRHLSPCHQMEDKVGSPVSSLTSHKQKKDRFNLKCFTISMPRLGGTVLTRGVGIREEGLGNDILLSTYHICSVFSSHLLCWPNLQPKHCMSCWVSCGGACVYLISVQRSF